MQIEFLNIHRGDNIVSFDTDTPEGRAKLAEEFQRLIRCETAVFLERAGKSGTETLRVTGYDPATDKLLVQEPEAEAQASPPAPEEDEDDLIMSDVEERRARKSTEVPEDLKDKTAKVGDVLQSKASGKKRRGRYKVKAVDATGKVVAVAPVSGGSELAGWMNKSAERIARQCEEVSALMKGPRFLFHEFIEANAKIIAEEFLLFQKEQEQSNLVAPEQDEWQRRWAKYQDHLAKYPADKNNWRIFYAGCEAGKALA